MGRSYWLILAILGVGEIISALYLAWINPVRGYDENWYLINSYHFSGVTALDYAYNRPPMLPVLLALFGSYYRLVPALAHIGSAALVFMILRRLATPALAIAGVGAFMVCGEMRIYNIFLLTEMPTIFFFLLAVYFHVTRRPLLFGGATSLATMTHWSMATVVPVALALYVLRSQWRKCGWFIAGAALTITPFAVMAVIAYGNPLSPFIKHLAIQRSGVNDLWAYAREFPQLPLTLIAGGAVALWWVWRSGQRWRTDLHCELGLLLLGTVFARLLLLHMVTVKSQRYLVPLVPALLLLTVLMLRQCANRGRVVRVCLWVILFTSIAPGKHFYWQVHDLRNDPGNQIVRLREQMVEAEPAERIYTDFNDMAVMGQTGRPAVAVLTDNSWHHHLFTRPTSTRDLIPDGALYLTFDPGNATVIARADEDTAKTLWLVRWRGGKPVSLASTSARIP
ncbi:MAG: hypothetical protein JSU63_12880 [Phycisphaerales bacterium]|nr:MAG: hypothetical protein JSU63_12880 [Phycisphaerales bacterium]